MFDQYGGTEFTPHDFQSSLKRRLQTIAGFDDGMTAQVQQQAQLRQAQNYAQQMQQLAGMNPTGNIQNMPYRGGAGPVMDMPYKGGAAQFINAIGGQESGGNYGAVNRDSGALGKYQIMPANVASWSRMALGRSITPQQFLQNPQLQEKIAQYMLNMYYQRYGAAGAAVAWYAGEGTARRYMQNPSGYTSPQGNYPSIAGYVQSVLARMR